MKKNQNKNQKKNLNQKKIYFWNRKTLKKIKPTDKKFKKYFLIKNLF